MEFTPIGIVHSPFRKREDMPVQPTGALGVTGTIEVFDAYLTGLKDLNEFSHLILLYQFHHSRSFDLQVIPFLDTVPRGLFSTRAPNRPNAIGLSIVELDGIENGLLHIKNVDILDGTPLLDIKPYVPEFDAYPDANAGWFGKSGLAASSQKSDSRFK
ncbi:MAG: tRNA (N6-threonylcarbamoyladenosine(37)-N6)-methyltransferase TrmO [Gammaproteobacteria bacterium]